MNSSRLPCTFRHMRICRMELEPTRGQYNWKPIDDAIIAGKDRGQRVSLRVMTTNAHSRGYYCSPKWLFDLGCKSHEYDRGGDDPTSGGAAIRRIWPGTDIRRIAPIG
jgi:hypothetical protein